MAAFEGIQRRGRERDPGHNRGRKPPHRLAWDPGIVGRYTADLYAGDSDIACSS